MDPHRLRQLATSNATLMPKEVAFLRQKLTGHRQDIEILSQHTTHLDQLQIEAEAMEVLLGPFRHLSIPLEIFAHIFSLVLSTTKKKLVTSQLIDLCLVCRSWREAALSAPRLWSIASIDLEDQQLSLPNLERWFSRAGRVPRSLYINGETALHKTFKDCPLNNQALARMLAGGAPFQHLTLRCESMSCLQFFIVDMVVPMLMEGASSGWQSLPSLKLKSSRWSYHRIPYASPAVHFFDRIPQVTSLFIGLPLKMDHPPAILGQPPVPHAALFDNLTTFTLACDWELRWAMSVLKLCTNVEDLTLDFVHMDGYRGAAEAHQHQTVLPKVRSLRMRHCVSTGAETRVLEFLEMPSLEEIDVSYQNHVEDVKSDIDLPLMERLTTDLMSLVTRSKRVEGLRRLRLHFLVISPRGLRTLFLAWPFLEHVVLDNCETSSSVFRWAAVEHAEMLPRLEVLEVTNAFGCVYEWEIYAYLEDKRKRSKQPGNAADCMKKVVLSFGGHVDDRITGETWRQCLPGLDVDAEYY